MQPSSATQMRPDALELVVHVSPSRGLLTPSFLSPADLLTADSRRVCTNREKLTLSTRFFSIAAHSARRAIEKREKCENARSTKTQEVRPAGEKDLGPQVARSYLASR